jgi:hypothetical protein
MSEQNPTPGSEIILYQTGNGSTRPEVKLENETVWLSQAQIAELFQTTPQNITIHLRSIFAEGELSEAATCKDYLQVRLEWKRNVERGTGRVHFHRGIEAGKSPEDECVPLIHAWN